MTQLHIYIYPFFFRFFSHVDYYRTWWMFTGFFFPPKEYSIYFTLPLPASHSLCLECLPLICAWLISELQKLLPQTAPSLHDPGSIWYLCLFRKLLPWCWFCFFGTESPLAHPFVNCELLEGRNNIPSSPLTLTECLICNRYTVNVC